MSIIVKLAGRSHKGKNRIREHGELWEMRDMGFWQGKPAMMLFSRDGRDFRWVEKENDPDFVVLSIDRIGMLDTIEVTRLVSSK